MWIGLVLVIVSGAVLVWFAPSHRYLDTRKPWDPRNGHPDTGYRRKKNAR